jgi:hypothetical protein
MSTSGTRARTTSCGLTGTRPCATPLGAESHKPPRPPGDRRNRVESDRFGRLTYDDLTSRDKVNLDIIWLKDDSLEDPDSLPEPLVLISETHDELKGIMRQFSDIAAGLGVDLSEVAADLA